MSGAAARVEREYMAPAEREPTELPRRPRRRRRPTTRPRVRLGVLWILTVGALLAGIVALNLTVLQLNLEVERLEGERVRLEQRNAEVATEISRAAAAGRIEAEAQRLGLVIAQNSSYLHLPAERP